MKPTTMHHTTRLHQPAAAMVSSATLANVLGAAVAGFNYIDVDPQHAAISELRDLVGQSRDFGVFPTGATNPSDGLKATLTGTSRHARTLKARGMYTGVGIHAYAQ